MSKEEIFKQLEIISVPTLLCSIVNPYIFPDKVLGNKNITAINMHHALLPKHSGRNSEAWAIYEQDKCAGITWHFISSIVDGGPIIAQEGIELTEEMTAYRLFELQDKLAIQVFRGFYKKLLYENMEGKANVSGKYRVHLSKDRPNEGFLNLDWNGEKIRAFLRSMDYGPLNTLGRPMIWYNNVLYEIKKYKISKSNSFEKDAIRQEEDIIAIDKDEYSFNLICVPLNKKH